MTFLNHPIRLFICVPIHLSYTKESVMEVTSLAKVSASIKEIKAPVVTHSLLPTNAMQVTGCGLSGSIRGRSMYDGLSKSHVGLETTVGRKIDNV